MHVGIAGPFSVKDLDAFLPGIGTARPWQSTGSPLLTALVEELVHRRFEVSVFTTDYSLEGSAEPWMRFESGSLKVYVCPARKRGWRFVNGRPGRMLDFFAQERKFLTSAILHAQPDVLHAHWAYEYGAAALAAGVPSLITCHDAPFTILRYMPDMYRLFRLLLGIWVLRRARFLTVVSPYLERPISRLSDARIGVVPNPVANWIFSHRQNGTPPIDAEHPPQIGMVLNGWNGRKNPKPAMLAMTEVVKHHPGAKMHLVGPGYSHDGPASTWAKKVGIHGHFLFHGQLSHRAAIERLASLHVLVHPALEESFGLNLAEAMALGVPVIGGENSGAVPWVLGAAGVLTCVRRPVRIGSAIIKLLNQPSTRKICADAGIQRSKDVFSVSVIAKLYIGHYESLLRGGSRTVEQH